MKSKLYLPIALSILLAGCSLVKEQAITVVNKEEADFQKASNVWIITDKSSGCQYVIINKDSNNAVMSPYYNSNGNVNGCRK